MAYHREFTVGDYKYIDDLIYIQTPVYNYVHATATSKTKSSYGAITNNYIIINGVLTPTIYYDGEDYIVLSLEGCFKNCTNLVSSPSIPSTVEYLSECFSGCTKLTTVDGLHDCSADSIDLSYCFYNCTSLITPPMLPPSPSGLDLSGCFSGCTSLIEGGVLDGSYIASMYHCYDGCTSLVTPPILPNTIQTMDACFKNCSKLQSAPIIYDEAYGNNVSLVDCFFGCTSLSGDVYLPSSIRYVGTSMFESTGNISNKIYVHTKSDRIDDIVATSSFTEDGETKYTAVAGSTNVNICNTRRLTDAENTSFGTTNGVRIDMLIDGSKAGIIEGLSRSGIVFYNAITNTQITFPTTLGCVRSYAIVDNVPNIPTAITFKFLTRNYYEPTISVYAPCTAQPCDLIHDGDTNPMSINITTQNVIVHGAGSDAVTLYTFLGFLYRYIYPSTYGRLIADFIGKKTDRIQQYDGTNDNTKHINMTADSIKVTNDSTLQDVITQLYNDLSGT